MTAEATGNQDLSGFSMMDLFRGEAEAQTVILNEGLLEIEKDPSSKTWLDRLMRAAHSLKGAARIVGLTSVVKVAHALEDCFVAAQKGQIVISLDQADILLRGVDMLVQMSKFSDKEFDKWISDRQKEVDDLLGNLEIVRTGGAITPHEAPLMPPVPKIIPPASAPIADPAPESGMPEASAAVVEKPAAASSATETTRDRGIRVSTENLSRLMGLAGESTVQAHRFEAFASNLINLKNYHSELLRIMKAEARSCQALSSNGQVLQEMLQKAETLQQMILQRVEEFDLIARQLTDVTDRLYRETIASRMRPFADGVAGFPRLVRDLSKQLGKKVKFEILGRNTQVDRDILDKLESPLTHFLSNSVDHGIELPAERIAAGKNAEASIKLEARHRAGRLTITVSDDGRGVDIERLRKSIVKKGLIAEDTASRLSESEILDFIFLPGFSMKEGVTEVSGRGVGLDVVRTFLHEVGGSVRVENIMGRGVRFHLDMPVTRSVMRALVVEVAGDPYAFPLGRIIRLAEVKTSKVQTVEGRQYVILDKKNVGLMNARQILGSTGQAFPGEKLETLPIVVIGDEEERYGIKVDRFCGERELVVRALDSRLGKVQDLSAVSLMEDGTPVLILDVEDLQLSIRNLLSGQRPEKIRSDANGEKKRKRILVVDDSITVREMERRLLQNQGYEVDVAVDGIDGWNALHSGPYDLVISDVDMPRMNGFDFVRRIRQDFRLHAMPVMMVSYKERPEDRMKGLEAGANCYFTKGGFHDEKFLTAIMDLIGEAGE
jgi:two-component system, chemotaxis family, sensor histidine kinase and response regulator WspE